MSIEKATVNILLFLSEKISCLLIYTNIYIYNTIHTDTYRNFLFIEFYKILHTGEKYYKQKKGVQKALRWECIWHVLEQHGAPMWLK